MLKKIDHHQTIAVVIEVFHFHQERALRPNKWAIYRQLTKREHLSFITDSCFTFSFSAFSIR